MEVKCCGKNGQKIKEIMRRGCSKVAAVTYCFLLYIIFVFHVSQPDIMLDKKPKGNIFTSEGSSPIPSLPTSEELVTYSIPSCQCFRKRRSTQMIPKAEHSFCSDFSTQRGKNTKVFSYSTYNVRNNYTEDNIDYKKYLGHVADRAAEIKENFPGWVMRLYHNISIEDKLGTQSICQLFCSYKHVDLCDVKNLPVLGNLYEKQPIGRLWRFAVMGDPTVSIFNSRDTDSAVLSREVEAVKEWLKSEKTFHVMRDHPYHYTVMLAGLWGAKAERIQEKLAEYREKLFSGKVSYNKGYDQAWLKNIFWPFVKFDVLQHDSFNCLRSGHEHSIPFPTKREGFYYVGWGTYKIDEMAAVGRNKCPKKCRPKKHKDWVLC